MPGYDDHVHNRCVQLGMFCVCTFLTTRPWRFPLWTHDPVLSGRIKRDCGAGLVRSPLTESFLWARH